MPYFSREPRQLTCHFFEIFCMQDYPMQRDSSLGPAPHYLHKVLVGGLLIVIDREGFKPQAKQSVILSVISSVGKKQQGE